MASSGCCGHPVANVQIEDLPDEMHEELRQRARLKIMTIRRYVKRLIAARRPRPARSEWLERIRSRRPVDLGAPVAEWVADDRARRTPRPPRSTDR